MQNSERTIGDVVIVDVSGKVTLGDGGDVALRDKMRSLIQQGQKKVLEINREHRKKGLFIVELLSWADIEDLLDDYSHFVPAASRTDLVSIPRR